MHDPIILGNQQPFVKGHGDSRYLFLLILWMDQILHLRTPGY